MSVRTLSLISVRLFLLPLVLIAACTSHSANDSDQQSQPASASERAITLGGPVTEIVYALGAGEMIVGTDVSSTWPDSATKLPQVGYQRTLSAENVLSLSPTLIIASEEAGPPAAIEQLRNSGVRVIIVPSEHSAEGARTKILEVAKAVGRESEGEALARRMDEDMQVVLPAHNRKQPSVMFIYTRGAGALQVSGSNTAANAMIELAGARNAIEGYEGYKPLTPEAGIAAAPDVILIPEHGLQQLGGVEALLNTPGIAETPAGKYRRVIAMDDLYLLGFGPRFGKARQELAQRIHDAIAGADNASSL